MPISWVLRVALVVTVSIFTSSVVAQDGPKPLGIPLGATVEQARSAIAPNEMQASGINRFSEGPMFAVSAAGLGVEDLQTVLLIFDKEHRMVALHMTLGAGGLGKTSFDRVLGHLKKQYKPVAIETPFVGNKRAVFETGDARIDLEAPHMSFEVTLTYMTKQFYTSYTQKLRHEEQARRQSESGRF